MRNTKKLALSALFLAVALIIGVIENLIPPIFPFLPYIKIGFSNIVIITAIIALSYRYALIISILKSVFVPLLVGNPIMIFYSLPAGLASAVLCSVLLATKKVGIPTVAILSAILHNVVQLAVAAIMTNALVFGYLPYFVVIGTLSGLATGTISFFVIKALPEKIFSTL